MGQGFSDKEAEFMQEVASGKTFGRVRAAAVWRGTRGPCHGNRR